ncbi:MAG: tRNA (N6-threonylcarbamoyladenosine(37)-N6)-methyltransferase TrmO [Patescibacteria group bacterium]
MDAEFCKFLGRANEDGSITVNPLGRAKNSIDKPTLPGWKDVITEIVINADYAKGLDGIEDYSHIIVVYWMDKETKCHLRHHPQGRADVPFGGIFACRCPQRPNPIAMSTVELVGRENNNLKVKGLDILNNTPILDIKPYWPQYDKVNNAKVPAWVDKLVF